MLEVNERLLNGTSKFLQKNIKQILQLFCLSSLYALLLEHERVENAINKFNQKEYYEMDNNITRFIIKLILDTEEYTMEGIAFYTHIPFDVVFDAACGIKNEISGAALVKLMALLLQVKPEVAQELKEKFLKTFVLNNSNLAQILLW